ncbi:demethoxyubiquinone hydroxylase family protein [Sneathiella sp. CAU 1612]|uniref:Demethoxyubiquinone hydroxylase family protein n=1 Tax=Sneathiella sedimenti TaxID=2816034 RepID=A0ABS3FAF6_9PROT|nr:demethoxyubiquinone hydroxylase family protein [Sneathiella sedimenti]MBO0334932.1 demethoxyubiquinone hydroxylase family protein [Sneathiella sedimenti]
MIAQINHNIFSAKISKIPTFFDNSSTGNTFLIISTLRPAQTKAEKMIKVNHAGENGAVNIYRAQRIVARFRSKSLVYQLEQNMEHELAHRKIFANYLVENGIRRCKSYFACGAGGYVLGFVTGIIGPGAVAATTYAVENVVLEHLEEQRAYLCNNDLAAHACVAQIIEDEKAHHDAAKDQLEENQLMTNILIQVVKFCTECVIRFGMR